MGPSCNSESSPGRRPREADYRSCTAVLAPKGPTSVLPITVTLGRCMTLSPRMNKTTAHPIKWVLYGMPTHSWHRRLTNFQVLSCAGWALRFFGAVGLGPVGQWFLYYLELLREPGPQGGGHTGKPMCTCARAHPHAHTRAHTRARWLPRGRALSFLAIRREHCFFSPQDCRVLLSGFMILTQRQGLHPSLSSAKRSEVVTRCVSFVACELERTILSFH